MTNDELTQFLYDQPVGLLHRLARDRVPRHFRMGKNRIIQCLLELPKGKRARLIVELGNWLILKIGLSNCDTTGKTTDITLGVYEEHTSIKNFVTVVSNNFFKNYS